MDFKILKSQEKKVLIAGILLAIAFLYIEIAFILKPQLRTLSAKAAKLHQVGSRLREYKRNFASLKDLQAQADASQVKKADIQKNIFSDNDIPFILDTIFQQAAATGVKIMQIKPLEALSPNEKPLEAAGSLNFYPLPFNLQVSGAYHRLGEFINHLENNPLISIVSIKLGTSSAETSGHLADVEIIVYVQKK